MKRLRFEEWPDWLQRLNAESQRIYGLSPYIAVSVPPDEAGEGSETVYAVMLNISNARIVKMDPGAILEQWCYHTDAEAIAALFLWDGLPPGPPGWIRNLSRRGLFRRNAETGEVYESE